MLSQDNCCSPLLASLTTADTFAGPDGPVLVWSGQQLQQTMGWGRVSGQTANNATNSYN